MAKNSERLNPNKKTPLRRSFFVFLYLGSSSIELDENANLISYEEYHPFGTTSYRSGRSAAEVSLKRYRYVAKEKDEETGLYYYGFRYYDSSIARFINCDPIANDYLHVNPYNYAENAPISYIDLWGLQKEDKVDKKEGSAFIVVSMDKIGMAVGSNVEKWSNGRIIHVNIPEGLGRKAMENTVAKVQAISDGYELGVGLLMFVGTHGWTYDGLENVYDGDYNMRNNYSRNDSRYNRVDGKDWELLRKLNYMEGAIIFSQSCDFATKYSLASNVMQSKAAYLSTFGDIYVIGADSPVSIAKETINGGYTDGEQYIYSSNPKRGFFLFHGGSAVEKVGTKQSVVIPSRKDSFLIQPTISTKDVLKFASDIEKRVLNKKYMETEPIMPKIPSFKIPTIGIPDSISINRH